jgi:hypothetical protein
MSALLIMFNVFTPQQSELRHGARVAMRSDKIGAFTCFV